MLLGERVDMAHALLLEYLVYGDEDTRFLYFTKLVVDGCAKYAHRGAQSHIGIDKRRYVVAALAHFGVEYLVVFLEIVASKEFFQLFAGCVDVERRDGRDKVVFVAKVLVEEE